MQKEEEEMVVEVEEVNSGAKIEKAEKSFYLLIVPTEVWTSFTGGGSEKNAELIIWHDSKVLLLNQHGSCERLKFTWRWKKQIEIVSPIHGSEFDLSGAAWAFVEPTDWLTALALCCEGIFQAHRWLWNENSPNFAWISTNNQLEPEKSTPASAWTPSGQLQLFRFIIHERRPCCDFVLSIPIFLLAFFLLDERFAVPEKNYFHLCAKDVIWIISKGCSSRVDDIFLHLFILPILGV